MTGRVVLVQESTDNTRGHLNWIPSGGRINRRNEMSDASCMLDEKSCA